MTTSDTFWNWLRDNGDRLLQAMYGQDSDARQAAFAELKAASEEHAFALPMELSRNDDGSSTLIVTPDGQPERVDPVKQFVASAPELPGWNVVPFRPRMHIGDSIAIRIRGQSIGPEDIRFRLRLTDESGLELTLYVRGLSPRNEEVRGMGASLLAQHALGEQDVLTMIGSIRTEPLPADLEAGGAKPFSELVATLDHLKEQQFPAPGLLVLGEEDWQIMQGAIDNAPALVFLNRSLLSLAGHPDYDVRLTVSIPFIKVRADGLPETEEEYAATQELGDRVSGALSENQESLHVATVLTQGRRDVIFQTSELDKALPRLEPVQAMTGEHSLQAHFEFDTYWGLYRTFCNAIEQQQQHPPAE